MIRVDRCPTQASERFEYARGHRSPDPMPQDAVDIFFRNAKLAQMLNEEAQLLRAFDAATARQIRLRLAVLVASPTLADVPVRPPDGRHRLKSNPEHQFAVYAGPGRRIVFEPATPPAKTTDGRLDLRKVTAVTILDIVRQD